MRTLLFIALACLIAVTTPVCAADLSIALSAEVTSVDPHHTNNTPNNSIAEQIFDTLIRRNASQQPIPGLAEKWRKIDDLTWEFTLRKGVKFHDGSDFTAEDVAFSLDRPAAIKSLGFMPYTRAIVEKIIVDPYTIRLKTAKPYAVLDRDMMAVAIVSSRSAKDADTVAFNSGKAAIGTGPFKLTRFEVNQRVELSRNDDYWGPKSPWDRVVFLVMTDDATRVAAFLPNQVQVIEQVPTALYAKLRADESISIFRMASHRMVHLQLDSNRDKSPHVRAANGAELPSNPLKDVRVRQAISKAINRQALVDHAMDTLAVPAGQFVPAGFLGVVPGLSPEQYDPAGARKLLAEAGYPQGFSLTLHGPQNRLVNDDQIIQAVAAMLTRVGIRTKAEPLPFSVYLSKARALDFSAVLQSWGTASGEAILPLRMLTATFDGGKGFGAINYGRYSNPKADALLEEALGTLDDAKRERLLQQITTLVIKDYGIIPLHFQVNTWAMRRPLEYEPRIDERTYAHEFRPGKALQAPRSVDRKAR